jgi:hypothetical protein
MQSSSSKGQAQVAGYFIAVLLVIFVLFIYPIMTAAATGAGQTGMIGALLGILPTAIILFIFGILVSAALGFI